MDSLPSRADSEAREALAAYFCRMADAAGFPRSVALIYHTLYLSPAPLSFAEIVDQTRCSKASASVGLKFLGRIHGVEIVILPDDRRTFYRAERSIRRLITGFIQETLQPGLEAGQRILDRPTGRPESELSPDIAERLASLRQWHRLLRDVLPSLALLDPPGT